MKLTSYQATNESGDPFEGKELAITSSFDNFFAHLSLSRPNSVFIFFADGMIFSAIERSSTELNFWPWNGCKDFHTPPLSKDSPSESVLEKWQLR